MSQLGGGRNYVMQTLCPLLCVTAGLYCCTSRFPRCSEGVWLWKLFPDLRTCIPVPCRLILVGPTLPFLPQTWNLEGILGLKNGSHFTHILTLVQMAYIRHKHRVCATFCTIPPSTRRKKDSKKLPNRWTVHAGWKAGALHFMPYFFSLFIQRVLSPRIPVSLKRHPFSCHRVNLMPRLNFSVTIFLSAPPTGNVNYLYIN